jgi:hypothetical protein
VGWDQGRKRAGGEKATAWVVHAPSEDEEGRKIDVMEMKALKWESAEGAAFWSALSRRGARRTKDKEGPKLKDRRTTIRRFGIEGR